MKSKYNFTVLIEQDAESGEYVGSVPAIPGAHTCAGSIDQLLVYLKEVIELCLEEMDDEEIRDLPVFTGISQIEVAV